MNQWVRYRILSSLEPMVCFLPLTLQTWIIRQLAYLFVPFSNIVRQYKQIALQRSDPWTLRYQRCVARAELHILRLKKELPIQKILAIKNEHYLQECQRQNRGTLLISVHHYYCILFLHWINQQRKPYLLKSFESPKAPNLHRLVQDRHHEVFQGRLLDIRKNLLKAARILQKGGTVLLLQDLLHRKAEPIQFLGKPRRNPLGSVRLAEMTDSLILPVVTTHNPDPSKQLWMSHFFEPIDPRNGNTKAKVIQALEKIITTYPESWSEWASVTMDKFPA
jgi:lauroyl/myristoyl acyltransferase